MNRSPMGVNSLPKTVTRQCRSCDLNPGPTAPESSTLTTQLPSHHILHTGQSQSDRPAALHPVYNISLGQVTCALNTRAIPNIHLIFTSAPNSRLNTPFIFGQKVSQTEYVNSLPSILSHCWLGVRKSIRPVKIEWFKVLADWHVRGTTVVKNVTSSRVTLNSTPCF